jgi:glucokinase
MTIPPAPIASTAARPQPPFPCLVADIGGTNARFGWVAREGAAVTHVASYRVADHEGPLSAAKTYLAQTAGARHAGAGAQHAEAGVPRSAAWALATALHGDRVELTNAGWSFSRQQMRATLGLDTLLLLNDFEALALCLPQLAPQQLRPIGAAPAQTAVEAAARAVIGPGTGLGVAGLVPCPAGAGRPSHWLALPGEGGHTSLAAADDFEAALLAFVRRRFAHVSAERLLSGIGLPLLHEAVAAVLGRPAEGLAANAIVAAGVAEAGAPGADPLCRETLQHFCALLGGFAGNVALTLGARGGVYLGGGIVPRLGELFMQSRFRQRFEAKGRFEAYLAGVPTWLIVDTHAALAGAALALVQQQAQPQPGT